MTKFNRVEAKSLKSGLEFHSSTALRFLRFSLMILVVVIVLVHGEPRHVVQVYNKNLQETKLVDDDGQTSSSGRQQAVPLPASFYTRNSGKSKIRLIKGDRLQDSERPGANVVLDSLNQKLSRQAR